MMALAADRPLSRLSLPPGFSCLQPAGPADTFGLARRIAGVGRAGTLVLVDRSDVIDFAVVLEPGEPLVTARRAFFAAMTALARAVGASAPPEKPITFDWPGTLRFDGARLGGGRLGWPDSCGEGEVPDWLVFSAMLIASKARAGDPGHTPDSTSLEEEGFELDGAGLVESFARHLMKAFDLWTDRSFAAIEAGYLAQLPPHGSGERRRIDRDGDLVCEDRSFGTARRRPLLPALRSPSWLDPASRTPLL